MPQLAFARSSNTLPTNTLLKQLSTIAFILDAVNV
jgi:hypothetical protein